MSLDLPRVAPCFPFVLTLHGMAGATDVSNFLTCVLNGFSVLLVLGVDEIDSTQFSLHCQDDSFFSPLLLFLQLSVLSH